MSDVNKVDDEINRIRNNQRIYDQATDDYTLRKTRANLFFDDDTEIEYLASQRFPNDKFAALKYTNRDGTLYYEDSNGKNVFDGKSYSKEFPDNETVGWWGDKFVPNIAPAGTFVADVAGGMAGAQKGFKTGMRLAKNVPSPIAKAFVVLGSTAVGGFGGNMLYGGGARYGREALINGFYSEKPEELEAAYYDLLESSTWSLLPFGTGTVGLTKLAYKFRGKEDALQAIINLGKDASVQKKIATAKEFGIDLTPAQATKAGSRARDIQYFITRQPDTRAITKFYESQASQAKEAIEVFADQIGSGKTVGDINTRIKEAGNWVMEELSRRRKVRGGKLYDMLKEAPEGIKIDEMQKFIDLIDFHIAGKDVGPKFVPSETTVKNLQKFKDIFYKDGELVDDLMSVHARRSTDITNFLRTLQEKGGGDFAKISNLKEILTSLMDETAPIYRQARKIYDPTRPSLQLIEKGVIGRFGKLMTDKQTATAMKNLFDPNVSIRSLRNARRLLQTADPDAFKDVKKQFILNMLDDVTKQSQLQKGLPKFKNNFQQPKMQAMMEEMLSPEEYASFTKLINVMDDAFSIPMGGSPTQPLHAMEKTFRDESLDIGTRAAQNVLNVNKLLQTIIGGRGFGDMLFENVAARQYERHLQNTIRALTESPDDFAKSMDEMLNYFDKGTFRNYQLFGRGVELGAESIVEPEEQPYTGEQRGELIQDIDRQIEQLTPNTTSSLMNVPAFPTQPDINTAMSPTVLPNPKDRELAMRQSGIAGLV